MHVLRQTEVMRWGAREAREQLVTKYPTLLSCDDKAEIWLGEKWLELHKGQMIFLSEGKQVELKKASGSPISFYLVSFQSYQLAEDSCDALLYHVNHSQLPDHGARAGAGTLPYRAISLLEQLAGEAGNRRVSEPADYHHQLRELIHLFGQALKTTRERVDPTMQEALHYMNWHHDQNLTRSKLAALAGFHTSYFSRLFQKQVGRSFSDHLTRVRVDKAKLYLRSGDATLSEIAAKVGYADGLYLSRKFKQIVGMSPSEYRQLPKPQRIVALQYTGDLLALGIKPVAAPFTPWEVCPLLHDELRGVLDLESDDSMQQIRERDVDLIIAPAYLYYWSGKLEKLEQVAPLLVLPWNQLDRLEAVKLMGQIVGREEAAEKWQQHYRASVAREALRIRKVIQPGETVGIYELWENQTICLWNLTARGAYNLYEGLGLVAPPKIVEEVLIPDTHQIIQETQLREYAADHMFVVVSGEPDGLYHDLWNTLWQRAEWKKLLEEKRRIYPLKLEEFWCNDACALEKQLGIMVERLLADQKGRDR